jgi:NADPH-dependent 2,4-dienoyl-CoA reductase/sulfur reductase-like enzyme/nitrite reductase/ring-hydroxylating ferredoxin subunit
MDLRVDGVAFSDLQEGVPVKGNAGDDAVIVVRRGATVYAVGANCTHYSGELADGIVVGTTVRCPLHHACFDLATGEARWAPALSPLPCWAVEQREGRVYVGAKTERDPLAPVGGATPAARPASIVIVGAGAAGAAAAEMCRRQGYDGAVTIIDPERDSPYDRPNLSKDYLAGTASFDWIPLRGPNFYADHEITIRRGRVAALDPAATRVRLDDGADVPYGALLLATGAEPNRLDNAGGAHYLRSLDDANTIIAAATGKRRAVVIGSSFIGLEVAGALRARGLEVDVISPENVPLQRTFGTDIGHMIRELHESHGVRFHLPARVERVADGAVMLGDGTSLPADLVVIGIGVQPRVELAAAAGLAVDRGVVVDAYLATSVAGVYAAGDIARWPDARAGGRIRVEHFVVAERMGQTAARNMLGARERFEAVPFFWSAHYDLSVRYVGHAERWDRADVVGDLGQHSGAVAFRAGGRTLAVATVGEDRLSLDAELALERGDESALARLIPG